MDDSLIKTGILRAVYHETEFVIQEGIYNSISLSYCKPSFKKYI